MTDFDDPYVYDAHVVEVIDGDTIDLRLDLGFHMNTELRFRLKGVDTHETYGVNKESEEFKRGKEEANWVTEWLTQAELGEGRWPLRIKTYGMGKYGRWMGRIQRKNDGEELNQAILDEFNDVTY